jgi:hypothetical protein
VLPTEEIERLPKEIFRTRNRSVRRVAQRLHRIARHKGEKALSAFPDRTIVDGYPPEHETTNLRASLE